VLSEEFLSNRKDALDSLKDQVVSVLKSEPCRPDLSKVLTRIDFALKRIRDGQYGLCTNCGVPIQEDLLEKIPETLFCIYCLKKIDLN
jgi:RNA polymerase-binding transcription factor DksA